MGLGLVFAVVMPVVRASHFGPQVFLTNEEYNQDIILPVNPFISSNVNKESAVSDEAEKYIDLKLFGLIKIKRVKVDILPFDKVYAGGLPIGFTAKTDGVIVLEDGLGFQKGDIIKVDSAQELKTMRGREIQFERAGKIKTARLLGSGLWVKDETSGIGMLTYINPENNNFSSLGHRPTDYETGAKVDVVGGEVYQCNVIGIKKWQGKKTGEFKSSLVRGKEAVQGSILSSNDFGVFGCLNKDSELVKQSNSEYPISSRYNVRPGKAKLRTSLDGLNVEEFDIEIIKTRYQKKKAAKGMIVRITDKRLLEQTGGIIHGMSGSPIIQNGRIVGALTHVTMNDAAKGYGIYIDFVVA